MTTIIVPVDFSEESLAGLELATMFADKMNANIQLVHVITEVNDESSEALQNEHIRTERNFQELVKNFKTRQINPIDVNYITKEGKVYQEISNHASSTDDSLIVLSTHGKSGFEEFFMGSNAYKIISASKRPVISVRNRRVPKTIKKIVMPLNVTFQTREKVPFTSKIAKLFGSEIHIVTVRSTHAKSIEKKLLQYANQVSSYLEAQNIPFHLDHLYGSNHTDVIRDYADSIGADLISVMTEQEKSISNMFLGSYTHQMINTALIPVLVFPNYEVEIPTEDLRTQGVYYE